MVLSFILTFCTFEIPVVVLMTSNGLVLCTVLTAGADTMIAKMEEPQRRSEVRLKMRNVNNDK